MINAEYEKWKPTYKININKGVKSEVQTKLGEQKYTMYPIKKEDKQNIKLEVNEINYVEAPLLENSKLGSINVLVNNKVIYTVDILSNEEVKKKDIKDYFFDMIGMYSHV